MHKKKGFRTCKRCGEMKSQEEFSGRKPICNSCKKPAQEKVYKTRAEARTAQKRRYYKRHPDKAKEKYIRKQMRRNPNYMSQEDRRAKKPLKKTPEEVKAAYRRKCKRCGEYLPLDKFEGKRRICLDCANKPIGGYEITEYSEKKKCQAHRSEARKRGLVADFTYVQWVKAKEAFNNKCAYCGAEHYLSQDHFIPVCKGGGYTKDNVIPSCHMCNSLKRDTDFFEWYPQQAFYSKAREQKILKYLNCHGEFQQLAMDL